MADHPITHPNLSFVSFSGNDSDLNAKAFWTSVENKIVFSLGQRPTDAGAQPNYDHRQKSLFGSLLTETALEWYTDEVTNTTTWAELKSFFLKRFTDGRDRFKHRIDAENATRQEGELIKNYFHRIKTSVDKGWPESIDTTVHADADAQALEKNIQTRQRTQKYIDFSVKGLKPLALKQKAHEYMIENPNAGWVTFTNHIITKDLTFIVATDPANKTSTNKMTSLETQIKELTKLIKNQEVSAINEQHSFRRRDPDVKGRPNKTRFCDYCRMNGHSISRCSKKQVQDEVNKLRKELTIKNDRKVSFETDYKRNRNFSNQRNYNQNDQSRNNNFTNRNGLELQISRIKVTMVFVIIVTIAKTVIQEIINSHHTIPIPDKTSHMTKNTQNKILSEIMNKLQNSIMTKRKGNPAVILEVDNIIKTDITEQIVVILIDQDHQDSE